MSPLTARPPAPEYWRGLEQLSESPEVQAYLEAEFPEMARQPVGSQDRRTFLRLLAGSLALGGVTLVGCRRYPVELIRPHAARPAGSAPGVPQFYATSFELDGVATGVLAKSYDGRPIKIEGNPDHPFSCGAGDPALQASVWSLYDPERARVVLQRDPTAGPAAEPASGLTRTWRQFEIALARELSALQARRGEGLAVLSQPSSSPTWQRLRGELQTKLPGMRWFEYQPLSREFQIEGARAAFGQPLRPHYRLDQAELIVDFDADLLGAHPAHLRWARDWATGRRSVDRGTMNRLVVIEPGYSITGSVADRRLALQPSLLPQSIAYLAGRFGLAVPTPTGLSPQHAAFLDQLAVELESARGRSVLAAGTSLPPPVQTWVHALNHVLGNHETTIQFTLEPNAVAMPGVGTIAELSRLLQGNVLRTVVIVGGNPLYDGPSDTPLDLRSTTARPLTTIHLSDYDNETSQACTWSLPTAHPLECWGDGRGWDGTYSVQQPLILPLFGGRSPLELLAMMRGQSLDGRAAVRATLDSLFPGAGAAGWESTLRDGLFRGSEDPWVRAAVPQVDPTPPPPPPELELRFVADYKVHDGRFANNAWLQELPDPITKLTWDNAALLSKRQADRLGVTTGDLLEIAVEGETGAARIEIPAYVLPGHSDDCLTLPLGYGRRSGGHIGQNVGCDVSVLRGAALPYARAAAAVRRSGGRATLACTQLHHVAPSIADVALRARLGEPGQPGLLIHETTLEAYRRDPHAAHGHADAVHPAPLFDPPSQFDSPHRWGMVIDLNACLGCSGCVVACQAENNIPVVGKSNVARNREMHWLRIDRYFKGPIEAPDIVHQPVACAHCENAPCEQVCPVAATVHDSEGLNAMVYNRCIGTRYCANNCPYKVRRFNYFDYQAADPRSPAKPWLGAPDQQPLQEVSPLKQLLHNPDVTVRMRGVMEKCTYCVQRIVEARITARNEFAQGLRASDLATDGTVQTACQAACPTQAIVFGDLNEPTAAVSQARRDPRNYALLAELNLQPRTTYLAKIRNR